MKLIANLIGSIICPYQILLDIAEQVPGVPSRLKSMAFAPICDLNSTNDWINLESLGKPVAIRAKAICDVLYSILKNQHIDTLSLEIHLGDEKLSSDNLYCLIYLAQTLNTLNVTFVAKGEDQSTLLDKIESLSSMKHVSIQIIDDISDDKTQEILQHLQQTRIQSIKSLGFTFEDKCFETKHLNEAILNQLIGFSWMCLKSGGYDIACKLLEKADEHADDKAIAKEHIFMHLLMVRFFSHQYALITESAFPAQFNTLEQSDVKTLQFLKAYSATLSRNLTVAQEFFTQCNINEQMQLSDEPSLYQLNLFALSRVLKGETDNAFELEFRIKKFIEEHQIDTVGLKYVNFINIARLYKKAKDYDLSLEYYNKAYNELSGGGYATSDHIYFNMNLGNLCEAAGNNEKALTHWVKAALHWMACKNQYELSWRPRLILCQEQVSDVSKPLPTDKANVFLLNKVSELMTLCGIDSTNPPSKTYHFIEDTSNIKKEGCFINKNIIIYNSTDSFSPLRRHPSASEQELAKLLTQFINATMDIPENQNLFIIDTQRDTELATEEEAMAYAALSNLSSCFYNGKWINSANYKSLKSMSASLSKVIHAITPTDKGLALSYKRSFLNKVLQDPVEIALVKRLEQNKTMDLNHLSTTEIEKIHQLSKKRVLDFYYQH
jgi:tetratricopeptide (TPR) repeat protein